MSRRYAGRHSQHMSHLASVFTDTKPHVIHVVGSRADKPAFQIDLSERTLVQEDRLYGKAYSFFHGSTCHFLQVVRGPRVQRLFGSSIQHIQHAYREHLLQPGRRGRRRSQLQSSNL